MLKSRAFLTVVAAALLIVLSCSRGGKVIPASKMSRIYAEMFAADQWLSDHRDVRGIADTTLFYEPIFKKYGYRREDFVVSVGYYVDKPETFMRILRKSADMLKKDSDRYRRFADMEDAAKAANEIFKHFERKDFVSDSVRWAGSSALWPGFPADSLPQPLDTLDSEASKDTSAVDSLDTELGIKEYKLVEPEIGDVEGKNSFRANKKQKIGELSRDKSLTRERKTL